MTGLKVSEVSRRLGVSEKTVYKWLREGLIPASRLGKSWIVAEDAVNALLSPGGGRNVPARDQPRVSFSKRAASVEDGSAISFSEARERLRESQRRFETMLSGAVEYGISAILGPRRLDGETPTAIAGELEAAQGEVLLQGIGLREFFGDKDHSTILRRMAVEDRKVSVRALLVNPTGQFARARTVVEDGEQFADDALFRAGPLFGDSWRSLNVIASLKKASRESQNFTLDVRFLDHWPSAYMVLTGNCAFVESYHFGRVGGAVQSSTIDGLVPMLKIEAGSDYYRLLRNHFDYLWSGKNPFIPSQTLEELAHSVQISV